jgi:purine-binding chemotaxis protein CheW
VGSEHYALSVEDVLEVAEIGDVSPVPGAAAGVLGVRNLRGQVLPVIDLAAVLGIPRDGEARRLVVAEQGGRRAGLAVDQLVDVGALPDASEQAESRYVLGAALVDGKLVGVVDVGAVLDAASTLEGDDGD